MLRRHKAAAKHMTQCSICNNFDETMGFYWRYTLLLSLSILMHSYECYVHIVAIKLQQ